MKKVTMYTGNPCPYCSAAKALLKTKNVKIKKKVLIYLFFIIYSKGLDLSQFIVSFNVVEKSLI